MGGGAVVECVAGEACLLQHEVQLVQKSKARIFRQRKRFN
jgi:hypothetical protein